MSDIVSVTPFRFEEFPDEILLEIFKCVESVDLHSFFGHNRRFNSIIQDIKLNIVIQYPEYENEDFNYLSCLLPKQFIRLELQYSWDELDLNTFKELRSLTVNCHSLSEKQFDQLLTVNFLHLERLSIDNVPHYYTKQLFQSIIDNEHFPSLKVCQLSGDFFNFLQSNKDYESPNNTIRTCTLSQCTGSQFRLLINLLPNLRRFETKLIDVTFNPLVLNMHHTLLEHLRLTVEDPLNDIKEILQYTPLLERLRVTGKITEDSVLKYFEAFAKLLRSAVHNLRQFDCELYFHAWSNQVDINIIQQLHPLFKNIKLCLGNNINQCYTTDLSEYPHYSEYSYIERQRAAYDTHNWGVMGGYDSDPNNDDYDDNDGNNDWTDYGLGYRGNYKANYGSSPWSGNNDD